MEGGTGLISDVRLDTNSSTCAAVSPISATKGNALTHFMRAYKLPSAYSCGYCKPTPMRGVRMRMSACGPVRGGE